MTLKLKTAPTTRLFTIDEIKKACDIERTDHDNLLNALIDAATAYLDGYRGVLGRAILSQVWELYYDEFPSDALHIPLGPVISVDSVEYVNLAGSYVTWTKSGNYEVDLASVEAWIKPVVTWPTPMSTMNAVRVTFTAGHAASDPVLASIKQAVALLVRHWYDNGSAASEMKMEELPFAVSAIIAPLRRNIV